MLHWGAKVTDKQTNKLGLMRLHLGKQLFLQLANYWFEITLIKRLRWQSPGLVLRPSSHLLDMILLALAPLLWLV